VEVEAEEIVRRFDMGSEKEHENVGDAVQVELARQHENNDVAVQVELAKQSENIDDAALAELGKKHESTAVAVQVELETVFASHSQILLQLAHDAVLWIDGCSVG